MAIGAVVGLYADKPDAEAVFEEDEGVKAGQAVPEAEKQASEPVSDKLSAPSEGEMSSVMKISHDALVLAREFNVDPTDIVKRGMIRQKDVRVYRDGLLRTADSVGKDDAGSLDPDFMSYVRSSPKEFGKLPSEFKVWLYQRHGALIGRNVKIGKGTVLDCERVIIGDDTVIGAKVQISCRSFEMGVLGEVGDRAKIICGDFQAGDGVGIRFDAVFVGATGGRNCRLGDNSFIAYDTYVNLDRDVSIGRHVCLAPGVRIYTHRKWLSPLAGYSTGFAPVILEDDVHLGSGVVVLPGVTVGRRVTVMANSVVAANTGAECLVGGVPAVRINSSSSYRRELDDNERERVLYKVIEAVLEALTLAGVSVADRREEARELEFTLFQSGERLRVLYCQKTPQRQPDGRWVWMSFDPEVLSRASATVTAIDLKRHLIGGGRDRLSDLLRVHLAVQGIEFGPEPWRLGVEGPTGMRSYDKKR